VVLSTTDWLCQTRVCPNFSTAAQWGQLTVPTRCSRFMDRSPGPQISLRRQLYYTTDDGTLTNTATIRANTVAGQHPLVRRQRGTSSRIWMKPATPPSRRRPRPTAPDCAQQSSYSVYNTGWTTNVDDNTRLTDEYGPAHTATLKNGTTGLYRTTPTPCMTTTRTRRLTDHGKPMARRGSASSSRKQFCQPMSTGSRLRHPGHQVRLRTCRDR